MYCFTPILTNKQKPNKLCACLFPLDNNKWESEIFLTLLVANGLIMPSDCVIINHQESMWKNYKNIFGFPKVYYEYEKVKRFYIPCPDQFINGNKAIKKVGQN